MSVGAASTDSAGLDSVNLSLLGKKGLAVAFKQPCQSPVKVVVMVSVEVAGLARGEARGDG